MAAADEGLHVVVTIAENGVVHAWGEGPVYGAKPGEVVPFANRARARRVADRFRREERARDDVVRVEVKVCKVLGIEPVEVKVDPT